MDGAPSRYLLNRGATRVLVLMLLTLHARAGDADATAPQGRHIDAVPDLVAGQVVPRRAPQQLGGILVGEPFDRTGFSCDDEGRICERPYRWDRLEGSLRVDTCGGLAQRVGFHILFTRDTPRARRRTAGIHSAHPVPDPERRAVEAVATLMAPVVEWEVLPPAQTESEGAQMKLTPLVSPSGQRRILMSSLGTGPDWFGRSWVIGTWAEADTECGDGAR
jgi:hypothetical protein